MASVSRQPGLEAAAGFRQTKRRAKDQPESPEMTEDDTVITRRDGRVGRILLNRPQVLNTLTLDMVRVFTQALHAFRDDPRFQELVKKMGFHPIPGAFR